MNQANRVRNALEDDPRWVEQGNDVGVEDFRRPDQNAPPAIIVPDNDEDHQADPRGSTEQGDSGDLNQNLMENQGHMHVHYQEAGYVPHVPVPAAPIGPVAPGLLSGGMGPSVVNAPLAIPGPHYSVNVSALAHYEAQMRDHAAAFANAAAGAAWAAAQLANNIQQHQLFSHSPPMGTVLQGTPQGAVIQQHTNGSNPMNGAQVGMPTVHDGVQVAQGIGQDDQDQGVGHGQIAMNVPSERVAQSPTNNTNNRTHQRHRDEDYHSVPQQPNKRRQRMQYEPLGPRPGQDLFQHEYQVSQSAHGFGESQVQQYYHHHMPSPLFSIMESSSTTMSNHSHHLEASHMPVIAHHHHFEHDATTYLSNELMPGVHEGMPRTLYDPSSDSKPCVRGPSSATSPFSVQNNSKNKRRHHQQSSSQPQQHKKQQDVPKDEKRLACSKRSGSHDGNLFKKKHLQSLHPGSRRISGEKLKRGGSSERQVNLVGKTGVAALYELCSKRHWETPKFVEISSSSCCRRQEIKDMSKKKGSRKSAEAETKGKEKTTDVEESEEEKSTEPTDNGNPCDSEADGLGDSNRTSVKRKATTSAASSTCSSITASSIVGTQPLNSFEFLISVVVNDFTYPPGRGGTKASARQDAARKALFGLLPGVVFDFNGILTDMPPSKKQGPTKKQSEDIQPEFSRLAIDQKASTRMGSGSTNDGDINEEGDASSVLSMETSSLASSSAHRRHHQNLMGSAVSYGGYYAGPSSGISSASEDDNADSYYASRGASVCSTLLHAMWQIDERIKEPPQYTYDVIAPIVAAAAGMSRSTSTGALSSTVDSEGCPVRGKMSSNGSVGSGTKQRLGSKAHRSTFSCTASLILYEIAVVESIVQLKPTENESTPCVADPETKEGAAKRTAESPQQENARDSRLKKKRVLGNEEGSSTANSSTEECEEHAEDCRAKRSDSNDLPREGDLAEPVDTSLLENGARDDNRRLSIADEIEEKSSKNLNVQTEVDNHSNEEQDEEDPNNVALDNQNQKLLEVEGLVAADAQHLEVKVTNSKSDKEDAKKIKLGERRETGRNVSIVGDETRRQRDDTTENATRLEAIGTGATKREARHVASAKLLALLFPHCEGTVEVIAAAEEARENYAAKKAQLKRKQQTPKSQQSQLRSSKRKSSNEKSPDHQKADGGNSSQSSQALDSKLPKSDAVDSADQISVEKLSISESKKHDKKQNDKGKAE